MTPDTGAWSRVPIVVTRRRPSDTAVRHEPITVGLPFPQGAVTDLAHLDLRDAGDRSVALQARALERWHDGSVRWALLDFQTDDDTSTFSVGLGPRASIARRIAVTHMRSGVVVETGAARFTLLLHEPFPFASVTIDGRDAIAPDRSGLRVVDGNGRACRVHLRRIGVEEHGPLRTTVFVEGTISNWTRPLLVLQARLHFFAGSAAVRCALMLRNPRPAVHPGGIWELGDRRSIYLRSVELEMALAAGEATTVSCSPEYEQPPAPYEQPLELYQDSSGGERWHSPNHRNRNGIITTTFRGYRLRAGSVRSCGERATPAVTVERGDERIAVAMEYFWQNFPKSLEVRDSTIVLGLFAAIALVPRAATGPGEASNCPRRRWECSGRWRPQSYGRRRRLPTQ